MRLILAAGLVALVAGCGESPEELVARQAQLVQQQLNALAGELNGGRIRNARILTTYADLLERKRPELKPLLSEFRKEATTEGLTFQALGKRLNAVNRKPGGEDQANQALEELLRIEAAADPLVFNDSLTDPINTLADLSQGQLARINAPQTATTRQAAATQMVGNPSYGQWRSDSSGRSFWVFYGQYALMRDLFFPRPIYYGSWYGGRGWSYYGDVGRHYYAPRSDESRWSNARRSYPNVQPRKSYGSLSSARRLSTYGQTAGRSPGAAARRASSYSGYGSSVRGTSRSRGASGARGK